MNIEQNYIFDLIADEKECFVAVYGWRAKTKSGLWSIIPKPYNNDVATATAWFYEQFADSGFELCYFDFPQNLDDYKRMINNENNWA